MTKFKFGQKVRVTKDGFYCGVEGVAIERHDDGKDINGDYRASYYILAQPNNTTMFFLATELETVDEEDDEDDED